jgi:hypothetical protein
VSTSSDLINPLKKIIEEEKAKSAKKSKKKSKLQEVTLDELVSLVSMANNVPAKTYAEALEYLEYIARKTNATKIGDAEYVVDVVKVEETPIILPLIDRHMARRLELKKYIKKTPMKFKLYIHYDKDKKQYMIHAPRIA